MQINAVMPKLCFQMHRCVSVCTQGKFCSVSTACTAFLPKMNINNISTNHTLQSTDTPSQTTGSKVERNHSCIIV